MIDGAILLAELTLFLLLLRAVWRASRDGESDGSGLFAFKRSVDVPPPPRQGSSRLDGGPHA